MPRALLFLLFQFQVGLVGDQEWLLPPAADRNVPETFCRINKLNLSLNQETRRLKKDSKLTISARDDLGALEDVLDAVSRVNNVVLGQVIPHVSILVAP